MEEEIRKIVNTDIILKYLFLESLDEKYGDEYISAKYRINAKKIRMQYEYISKEYDIEGLENEIKSQVDSGDIDLNKKAVEWHKDALKKAKRGKLDTDEANKEFDEER